MKYKLRDYQVHDVNRLRQHFRQGDRAVLYQLSTGGGKTVVLSHIAEGAVKRNNRVWVLVHRQELVRQTSATLTEIGVDHGIISPGHTPTWDNVQVASVQTLVRRLGKVQPPQLIIVDECFPAGTLISPNMVPIESIKAGDIVDAWSESDGKFYPRKVVRTFKRTAKTGLVKVSTLCNSVVATANHPFLTKRGWISAGDIKEGDHVYCKMRVLPDEVRGNKVSTHFKVQKGAKSLLQSRMWHEGYRGRGEGANGAYHCNLPLVQKGVHGHSKKPQNPRKYGQASVLFHGMHKSVLQRRLKQNDGENKSRLCVGTNGQKQSHVEARNTGKDVPISSSNKPQAQNTGRERKAPICAAANATGFSAVTDPGVYFYNRYGRERVPKSLQNRLGRAVNFAGNRDRRVFARGTYQTGTRQEEGNPFGWQRVDSVEIQEQTRSGESGGMPAADYVYNFEVEGLRTYVANGFVVHNCHHARANSWDTIIKAFPAAKILGVTATPARLDGSGMGSHCGGHFDSMVNGPTLSTLVTRGYLSKPRLYAPPVGADLGNLHKRFGEFKQGEVAAAMDKPVITGSAVEHYRKICNGVPAIAFCASIAHAEHVADQFRAAGFQAASIDGNMNDTDRKNRIAALGNGGLHVLTSCDVVSEGTDVPVVGAAILLRPTASLSLVLQQIGRALRVYPGKEHATILDHVGNIDRHGLHFLGLPQGDIEWSLDGEVKRKKSSDDEPTLKVKQCPQCYAVHMPEPRCPFCGHEYKPEGRQIEEVAGELHEIDQKLHAERLAKAEELKAKQFRGREEGRCQTLDDWERLGQARGYAGWRKWARIRFEQRQGRRRPESAGLNF